MGHVVLLGDSIFDNARYVPGEPAVIDQVRQVIPSGWLATLMAVDGHVTSDVAHQLKKIPADATHLTVSVGGNDALSASGILGTKVGTVSEALNLVHEVRTRFQLIYSAMLKMIVVTRKPAAVCTVYDAIPGLGKAEQVALAGFNEVILHEAFGFGLPVIDLRLVCQQPTDYSSLSPIEPSTLGGAKIAKVIGELIAHHDFSVQRSSIYI